MAESTGIALAVGGITAANEALFAPLTGHGTPWQNFNWRIIPATAFFALGLYGIEQVSPQFAKGLGYIALITVLFVRLGNAPSPLENVDAILSAKQKPATTTGTTIGTTTGSTTGSTGKP